MGCSVSVPAKSGPTNYFATRENEDHSVKGFLELAGTVAGNVPVAGAALSGCFKAIAIIYEIRRDAKTRPEWTEEIYRRVGEYGQELARAQMKFGGNSVARRFVRCCVLVCLRVSEPQCKM